MPAPTIYFHGQPGSSLELELFGAPCPAGWIAWDRVGKLDIDALAVRVRGEAVDGKARLIGFSIGAFVALSIAARLGDLDLTLELVSPASPITDADWMDRMAGGAVFRVARHWPRVFGMIARSEAAMARRATGLLVRSLLASCAGDDRELAADPIFRSRMAANLRRAFSRGPAGFRSEISAYVADWSELPGKVPHRVTIWQGGADNWALPAMTTALAGRLARAPTLHELPGRSHYSTLRDYLAMQAA